MRETGIPKGAPFMRRRDGLASILISCCEGRMSGKQSCDQSRYRRYEQRMLQGKR
jgi:hypothetical protein